MNIKKFYNKLKEFYCNPKELIIFFIPIIITIILLIPVDYTITIGGGTIAIKDKIIVAKQQKINGSFSLAYVKELRGNVLTYIIGKINPNYKVNSIKEETLDNETREEYNERERTYFLSSLDNATIVAFKKANKLIKITEEKFIVSYIMDGILTDVKTNDQIISVDNIKVNSIDKISNIVNKKNLGDKLTIKVLRNNKEIICTSTIFSYNNTKKIGIAASIKYEYETNPKVTFKFSNNELGPSGGLITALEIYNKLIEEDITKGKTIVGTGTIDKDGNVGEIGGITYKIKGAINENADIFILPKENYKEALAFIKENNYNIKLLPVSTFDEALELLK